MSSRGKPKRGEVWLVGLDPVVGDEMNKTRPVVVVSSDSAGALRIRTVAPFTSMSSTKAGKYWLVPVSPSATNGLTKDSVVDVMQVRGLSTRRFVRKLGQLREKDMAEVGAAFALLMEYE